MISAVVLIRNEEENIRNCLSSLAFCDEVIIIDDDSTDQTREKARQVREIKDRLKIYRRSLNGDLAAQHNFGLSKASSDWVLFIDADETVSEKLRKEIQVACQEDTRCQGYRVKRLDYFLGRWLRFGETGNIKLVRLGRKGSGQWQRQVHEYWDIIGQVKDLDNPLFHYPHPAIKDFIDSINHWTDLDAKILPNEGKNFSYWRTLLNPVGKFIQNYIFKLGFLDLFPGFVMAFMMSLHSLIVRVKMYELLVASSGNHGLSQSS